MVVVQKDYYIGSMVSRWFVDKNAGFWENICLIGACIWCKLAVHGSCLKDRSDQETHFSSGLGRRPIFLFRKLAGHRFPASSKCRFEVTQTAQSSPRILAVASAGGHWHQLCQICTAFEDGDLFYVTTMRGLPEKSGFKRFSVVQDCNQHTPFKALRSSFQMLGILLRVRPDIIITTGALPGLIAVFLGHLMRRRTIWVDSLANAEEPSTSGRKAQRFVSLWLSQWEDVAEAADGRYEGSLL